MTRSNLSELGPAISSPSARLEMRESGRRPRPPVSVFWIPRHLLTILFAHAVILVAVYFLLLLGDALFTSYAIVTQAAVFVSYVAQLGWLQRMAFDIKLAVAGAVALSAGLQMLVFLVRVGVDSA